jgi:pantothenate kinase
VPIPQCEPLIADICRRLETGDKRLLIGITGCPGAGKSTFAEQFQNLVNKRMALDVSIVVPMDGYHLSNERLEELGLLPLKGIPKTFDARRFVELLDRLRLPPIETVYCPKFDRSIEASIENAIAITPQHKLCIVEGNYLLLDEPPWNQCVRCLDEVWYLDVPTEILLPRLLQRHIDGGKTADGAREKVESTDLPNARLIAATKQKATKIISLNA